MRKRAMKSVSAPCKGRRARNSPARPSLACLPTTALRSASTAKGLGGTMSSSSGCGAVSNTRMDICGPTKAQPGKSVFRQPGPALSRSRTILRSGSRHSVCPRTGETGGNEPDHPCNLRHAPAVHQSRYRIEGQVGSGGWTRNYGRARTARWAPSRARLAGHWTNQGGQLQEMPHW